MSIELDALVASTDRLRGIVERLDDTAITGPAYPRGWTIAQVLSHLGSGAVIFQRRIDDARTGSDTPENFAPAVWDEWNAKSPRAQVDDGLAVDAAFSARLDAFTEEERLQFSFPLGPMNFDFEGFVGLRLNEHALHTWDIDVALDPAATIPAPIADVVVDNLDLITRFTATPVGAPLTITIAITGADRRFLLEITADGAMLTSSTTAGDTPNIELSAEAFVRLVYGRLDPEHTPPFTGDGALLDRLRATFPGP